MPPIRLGILGTGVMGSIHARSILDARVPGVALTAVCDLDPARTACFPGIPCFTDAADLFASGDIEAVLIATPHDSHPDLAVAALAAGLHVLVEKPIAVDLAGARRLAEAAAARPNRRSAVMFNQRTDPRYLRLREILRSGELGPVRRVHWTATDWFRTQRYYDNGGWRATWAGEGGGVLINQAVHQIDLLCWLFGLPDRVSALCRFGAHHDVEVEDDVTATLEYADGPFTAVFTTGTGETPGVNRLEIAADRGLVTVEGDTLRVLRNHAPARAWIDTCPDPYARPATDACAHTFPTRGPQHAGILANFADAIRAGAPLIAPLAEGVASVHLINAILLSAFEDRPVRLPIDPDLYLAHLTARRAASRYRPTPTDRSNHGNHGEEAGV